MLPSSLLVTVVALWQHASLVNANVLQVNPHCQTNACLSAVQSNRHHSDHKEWLPGCTSFFRKTVTPKPATKTVTTGAKATTTKLVTQTDEHKASITAIVTKTQTVHATAAVTVTESARAHADVAQRDADGAVSTKKMCPTGPAGPSQLPSYASACHNTVIYSSACSCVGVTHGVTTLPRCTNTVTVRPSGTFTFTKTIHVGATEKTTVATHTDLVTKTVTDDTTITVTNPASSTTSAVCAKLNAFDLEINSLDGSITNGMISETKLGSGLGLLTELLGTGAPASFKIDEQGHLLTAADEEVGVLGSTGTTFSTIPINSSVLGQYTQPSCHLGPEPNCDQLSCDLGDGRNKFAYCSGTALGVGKGLSLVASLPALGNCKFVNVTAAVSG